MQVPQSPITPAESRLGLYTNLPIDEHHGGVGISKSGLDDIDQSPLHYFAWHLDPRRPVREAMPAQLVGTLAHCALLEPAEFDKRYAVGPDVSRATKEWKQFAERQAGRECIKPDQYSAAMRQAEAMRALPQVRDALEKGQPEVSAYWTDAETGELCRCRPDWVSPVGERQAIPLDVKTCGDASPEDFKRQLARMRYHVQNAFYVDGYESASGVEALGLVFVAVEADWPHAASTVMLDDLGIEQGRRDYRRNLNRYAECRKTNVWPGYSNSIELVTLPFWAFDKDR